MITEQTGRRSLILAALIYALLLAPGMAPAGQTNTLESLKSAYGNERLAIAMTAQHRGEASLKQYGKALEALMAALKQKGDLKNYLAVETERKRFSTEGTVPDAKDSDPLLADALGEYQESVADAQAEQNRLAAGLLKNLVAGLDVLMKTLTQADRIEAAKAVMAERDKAAAELADMESKVSQETSASDDDRKSPGKREAMSGQTAGVKTLSSPLWVVPASRWTPLGIPAVKNGDRLLFRCEPRPLAAKGKYTADLFRLKIGTSDKAYCFDSDGKYVHSWGRKWRMHTALEPTLEVTADSEGRIFVYRNDVANLTLVVTVQRIQAGKADKATAVKAAEQGAN